MTNATEASTYLVPAVLLVLIAWYVAANRTWYRLLQDHEAGIHVDPMVEPGRWMRTGSSRFQRGLQLLRAPMDDKQLELWRRRTVNRGIVAVLLGVLTVVLGPILASSTDHLVTAGLREGGLWSVVISWVSVGGVLGYFVYRLARAAYRFGNGEAVSRTEFILGIYGIVAYILFAMFSTLNPIGG